VKKRKTVILSVVALAVLIVGVVALKPWNTITDPSDTQPTL